MTHSTYLPGPVVLAGELPAAWRPVAGPARESWSSRCSSLGCGLGAHHAGACEAERVPPVDVHTAAAELLDALDASPCECAAPGDVTGEGAHRRRRMAAQRRLAVALGRVPA